ncbi:hypothetical protein ACHAWF_003360 [Thalassiosira exigua]
MARKLYYHSKPSIETVPELPTIATWIRFVLGGLYGISLGYRNETRGMAGVLLGLNVITFMPMFWFNTYLDADVDSYKSLNFVGVPNALALMILIWIVIFTMRHEDAELALGKVIADAVTTVIAGGGDEVDSTPPDGSEDEF